MIYFQDSFGYINFFSVLRKLWQDKIQERERNYFGLLF